MGWQRLPAIVDWFEGLASGVRHNRKVEFIKYEAFAGLHRNKQYKNADNQNFQIVVYNFVFYHIFRLGTTRFPNPTISNQ